MGIIDPVASVDHQTRTPETHVITLWKTHCDLKNMNSYETDVFCLLTLGINLEISMIVFPKVCIALLFSSLQIYRFLIK